MNILYFEFHLEIDCYKASLRNIPVYNDHSGYFCKGRVCRCLAFFLQRPGQI